MMEMTDSCKDRRVLPQQELDKVSGGSLNCAYQAACQTCAWTGEIFGRRAVAQVEADMHKEDTNFSHDVIVVSKMKPF